MKDEINLHDMNYDDALRIFIAKYNARLRQGNVREIRVIHGYGAGRLDSPAVLQTKFRAYLSRQKGKLQYRLDLNPGVTYVRPILRLEWKGKKKK